MLELSKMSNIVSGQKNDLKWRKQIIPYKAILMAFFGKEIRMLSKRKGKNKGENQCITKKR